MRRVLAHGTTIQQWLAMFETLLLKPRRPEGKAVGKPSVNLQAIRSNASTAFWLMHSEALSGSGLTASACAAAH